MGSQESPVEGLGRMNFWKGKHVLVTGGAGLVGSHIAEELSTNGATVIVLDKEIDPRSYFVTQGLDKLAVQAFGNLKDYKRVFDVISKYDIEYIFHMGAQAIVPTSFINPLETFETNLMGTVNVLESARHVHSVKGIVVASSDKAYGHSEKLPYTEEMSLNGKSPYDASKSCTDIIAQSYATVYNLPVAIARFGNIYGPGDLNFSRIIPGAIKACLFGEALEIRSDGKMIREYLYVKDAVDGYLTLCQNIEKSRGEAFNLSSGDKLSVLEVVEKVSHAMGKKIDCRILNKAKCEIPEQYLSTKKIERFFGWKTKYPMEKGLKETVEWYMGVLK